MLTITKIDPLNANNRRMERFIFIASTQHVQTCGEKLWKSLNYRESNKTLLIFNDTKIENY